MRVDIRITNITCIEAGDYSGTAEPFLWPFFFRVDASTLLHVIDQRKDAGKELDADQQFLVDLDPWQEPVGSLPSWFHAPGGAHGNLGGPMRSGESRAVPESIGRHTFQFTPHAWFIKDNLNAFVGFHFVVLEQDQSATEQVSKAYMQMADILRSRIENQIDRRLENHRAGERIELGAMAKLFARGTKEGIGFAAENRKQITELLRDLPKSGLGSRDDWIVSAHDTYARARLEDVLANPFRESQKWTSYSPGHYLSVFQEKLPSEDGRFELDIEIRPSAI